MSLAGLKKGLDGDLELYGELMVKELRKSLAVKYPYAPGFTNSRGTMGTANKIANVPTGYNQNLYDSISSSICLCVCSISVVLRVRVRLFTWCTMD